MLAMRLFGFEVRLHPTFFLIGLFVLGAGWGITGVVVWMAAVLISVLIHELGHAFAARGLGARVGSIELHAMGGLTTWQEIPPTIVSWRGRILIALAGSGTEVAVALLVFAGAKLGLFGRFAQVVISTPLTVFLGNALDEGAWLTFFIGSFVWLSVFWGLINLAPIAGLDGYHVLATTLERFLPNNGRRAAAVIGLVFALVAAGFLYARGARFGVIVVLLFAGQELMRVFATPRAPSGQ